MCAAIERFDFQGVIQELGGLREIYWGTDVDMVGCLHARFFSDLNAHMLFGSQWECLGQNAHQDGKSRAPVLLLGHGWD